MPPPAAIAIVATQNTISTMLLYEDESTPEGTAKTLDTDRPSMLSAVVADIIFFLCFNMNPIIFIKLLPPKYKKRP
jgi:hypothetical protein